MEMLPQRDENLGAENPSACGAGTVLPISMLNENITDIRDLGRRYSRYGVLKMQQASDSITATMRLSPNPVLGIYPYPAEATGLTPVSVLGFRSQCMSYSIGQLYAFYSGGVRFKIVAMGCIDSETGTPLPLSGILKAYWVPTNPGPVLEGVVADLQPYVRNSFPATLTHLEQQRALEIEVPYTSAFNQLFQAARPDASLTTADVPTGELVIEWNDSGVVTKALALDVYYAYADDTSFSFLTSPPPEYFVPLP